MSRSLIFKIDFARTIGLLYGDILPAKGHLIDLLEPGDVVPDWKRRGRFCGGGFTVLARQREAR
jgi:hypothetical protein